MLYYYNMSIAFETHNHEICTRQRLGEVEDMCSKRGLRLTPVRRRVLEILLGRHQAMGAYELLDVLGKEGFCAKPPVVYRALSFLTENCFAHKVEKLNAFVACQFPTDEHRPGFMICRNCSQIGEARLEKNPFSQQDFEVETQIVEAEGLCKKCK